VKLNSTIVSKDIDTSIKKYLVRLKEILSKLENGSISFQYGGRPVRAQKSDLIRVISNMSVNGKLELGIRNIVLEAIMTADSLSAGSGYLLLRHMFDTKGEKYKYNKHVELKDVETVLTNMLGEGLSKKLVYSIIKESSINSGVSLSSSEMAFQPILTVNPSLEIEGSLASTFSTTRKRVNSTAVLFIDGIIESLGEIDNVLQTFSKEKKSLVIFARGYTPDVVATLSKNLNVGNLYVFPVKVAEKDFTLSSVEDHPNFYNIENITQLRNLSVQDFDFEFNVEFFNKHVSIDGIESVKRKAHITLPNRYSSLLGLIQDRIVYGRRLAKETSMTGMAKDKEENNIFSLMSLRQSLKSHKSLQKSLKNLGAIVLQNSKL
jgi:hypothetical protein